MPLTMPTHHLVITYMSRFPRRVWAFVLLQLAVFLRLSPRELSPSVEQRRDRKAARPRDGHSAQPVLGKVKVYTVRLPARLGTRGRTMCGCKPLPPVLWLLVRHVCGMPTSSDLFRLIDTCREMVIFYRWRDDGNFQSRLCRLLFFFWSRGAILLKSRFAVV